MTRDLRCSTSELHLDIILSQRTYTFGSNGWIRVCNHFQRSFHSLRPAVLIISFYIAISYFRAFKRFSFWSKPIGLEPNPSDSPMSQNALHLHQTSNPCCHQFTVVRTVLNQLVLWQHTSIWLYTHYSVFNLEQNKRLELSLPVWKTGVLPINTNSANKRLSRLPRGWTA